MSSPQQPARGWRRLAGAAARLRTADVVPVGYRSVAAILWTNQFISGTLAPRNAEIAHRVGLSPGTLGIVISAQPLGTAIGVLVVFPRIIGRFGAARVATLATVAYCAMLALVGVAPGAASLVGVLLAFGVANGGIDLAQNRLATGLGAKMLPRLEVWSIVGLVVAAVAAAAAVGRVPVLVHLAACAGVGIVAVLWRPLRLDAGAGTPAAVAVGDDAVSPVRAELGTRAEVISLIALASLALMAMLYAQDWGSVLLEQRGISPGLRGAGNLAFTAGLILSLRLGAALALRFGSPLVLRIGAVLFLAGMLVAANAASLPLILAGFVLAAIGGGPCHALTIEASSRVGERALTLVTGWMLVGLFVGKLVSSRLTALYGLPLMLTISACAVAAGMLLLASRAGVHED